MLTHTAMKAQLEMIRIIRARAIITWPNLCYSHPNKVFNDLNILANKAGSALQLRQLIDQMDTALSEMQDLAQESAT